MTTDVSITEFDLYVLPSPITSPEAKFKLMNVQILNYEKETLLSYSLVTEYEDLTVKQFCERVANYGIDIPHISRDVYESYIRAFYQYCETAGSEKDEERRTQLVKLISKTASEFMGGIEVAARAISHHYGLSDQASSELSTTLALTASLVKFGENMPICEIKDTDYVPAFEKLLNKHHPTFDTLMPAYVDFMKSIVNGEVENLDPFWLYYASCIKRLLVHAIVSTSEHRKEPLASLIDDKSIVNVEAYPVCLDKPGSPIVGYVNFYSLEDYGDQVFSNVKINKKMLEEALK
ncbi:MAG: hypothetical protein D6816_02405 [Bacteroidetes bacterium]|nr:MAG: hypothetical protein D6816_02405 [Bacteroidota bacterium]